MKKIFRIFIAIFFILNISIVYVHSETFSLIEEKLENIGVSEKYSDNIINYISNLKLSEEETKKILDEANDVISILSEKKDYSNFTFTELLNIYGEVLNIADSLNINLDLTTKEFILKDKDSNVTLIKCNIDDAKRYYKNYKKSPFTYQDYEELKSYISENTIINKENIKNDESNNSSNSIAENNNYNSKNNLDDEEIDKNSLKSDNRYNSTKNNTETLNSVSAIKRKNVNRVLSIIFLVLFTCVVISLLIDSIFFNKEKK